MEKKKKVGQLLCGLRTRIAQGSQKRTYDKILDSMTYLSSVDLEFQKLTYEKKFNAAIRFVNCQKGLLQRKKMYVDMIGRIGPIIVAVMALVVAFQKGL